jgi:hypothetical protein
MKKYSFLLFFLFLFSSQTFAVEQEQLPTDDPSVPAVDPSAPQLPSDDPSVPVADPSEPQEPSDDPSVPVDLPVAVIVNIGSAGGALDNAALKTVRQVVGFAVAEGVVDKFVNTSPAAGEPTSTEPVAVEPTPTEPVAGEPTPTEPVAGDPIPVEGGLSFCVEKGANITPEEFQESFINGLMTIQPLPGTTFSITNSNSCNEEDLQ